MFGHPIELNFNGEGNTKKTFIGGVTSVILQIVTLVYVGLSCKALILSERDDVTSGAFLI